jgi:membrane-bound lytic murein transglycosylase B
MSNLPVPTTGTPDLTELSYSEVLELQTLLQSLGMRPGILDGIPGPRTAAVISRYEESRGLPQTGNLDRELLKRLRQEPN